MSKQIEIYFACKARYINTFSLKGESANTINEVLADFDTDEIEGIFNTVFEEGEESFDVRGKEVEGFRSGMHMAFGEDISIYLDEDMEDPALEEIDSSFEFTPRIESDTTNLRKYPFSLNIPENYKINFDDSKKWVENAATSIFAKYKEGEEDSAVDELEEKLRKKLLMPFYDEGLCLYTVEKQHCQFKVTIELGDDENFDVEQLKFAYNYNDSPSTTNDDDEEIGVPAIYEGEFALRSVFYNKKAYDLEILDMTGSGSRHFITNDIFEGNVIYE